MLIKEYRIPLPLTVEEYRIAQLYMIAKKSREESKGAESGVEILVNEPYDDGPGGSGQYTHKIYHIGSHLPGWFKGLLPMSRLAVEEKAWNAYPYTKTRFSCPFVQRFSLEIETYYCGDGGHQENVFNLTGSELRNRVVDVIDVVRDQLYGADYIREEDPRWYVSEKTGRGPIGENWIEEYSKECMGKEMPLPNGKSIMTAYKLCKVELQFWGMQSKLENYIHSIGLRKTMLRAHRQAWAWQDEWYGLTMADIREIERQTQVSLKKKMAGESHCDEFDGEESGAKESSSGSPTDLEKKESLSVLASSNSNISSCASTHTLCYDNTQAQTTSVTNSSEACNEGKARVKTPIKVSVSDMSEVGNEENLAETTPTFSRNSDFKAKCNSGLSESSHPKKGLQLQWSRTSSKSTLNSPGSNSNKSFELLASWRMETLTRRDSDSGSGSEDEFFDCLATLADDDDSSSVLTKWSSMELVSPELEQDPSVHKDEPEKAEDSIFCQPFLQRVTVERERTQGKAFASRGSFETSLPGSPTLHGAGSSASCHTSVLCLVIHAGSALDAAVDPPAKKSDVTTFKGAFESVIRQHYPSLMGHVAIKLVSCPAVCAETLGILSSLSPYSFDVYGTGDSPQMAHESVPIGAIPILSTSKSEYWDAVGKTVFAANQVYQEFLRSQEGQGFSGQVVFIGDSMGSVLAYDALTKHSHSTQDTTDDDAPPSPCHCIDHDFLSAVHPSSSVRRRSSSSTSDPGSAKLDFEVTDFFMFGTPLGLILAHRKVQSEDRNCVLFCTFNCKTFLSPLKSCDAEINMFLLYLLVQLLRPCHQVYNLFHPTDPLAARLEPLTSARFAAISPVNVARYSKYPLGDGQPYHLLESIQCNPHAFSESGGALLGNLGPNCARRLSDISIQSGMSGLLDALPLQAISLLTQKWWGNKRIDYALYCPEALASFPTNSLPHLFHASYWESTDAIAFILRQIGAQDTNAASSHEEREIRLFTPNQPREKWMKKRTSVKLKNVSANHRANDIIIKEGHPQILKARFMYGPLDVVGLTGEKVDIYVMRDPPAGEWTQIATEVTDKNGRVTYTLPPEKSFSYGIYPIKMIVRGDHTCVDFYCAVVPPYTECVVFSIDGSFTASMSVTGRDPRVRAGAVDVTRHWQELGYLIIYVTGRPDMQQHKVVSWLAQHNFPHGLVSFADGLSTDFLGHKTEYLKCLVQDHQLVIHAAYGSSKDIAVYTSVGVSPERIFIIGKAAKKQHTLATVLTEGYSTHLDSLMAHGGSRPAHGNARMVIPRGYFGLPGQPFSIRRRKSAKRTTSYNAGSQVEETSLLAPEAAWGFSTRETKSPVMK